MKRRAPIELQPRLLPVEDAAQYFSLTVAAFKRLRVGEVPIGARVLYDRHALDAWLDQVAGLAPQSLALQPDNDPEAAFDRSAPDLRGPARRP